MRGLQEIVFSATNRCTARCQDCPIVHEGGPPHTLTAKDMISVLDEVLPWGTLELVVFTGGEPMLLGDDLKKCISYAHQNKIATRIVTNAYWATSQDRAREVLGELKEIGLTELNLSCDDYHQEFIPLKNIKYANEAACELDFSTLIAHRIKPDGIITIEYLSEFFGVELKEFKIDQENPKNNVIMTGYNIPIKTFVESGKDEELGFDESGGSWKGPCSSVLTRIIISPDKRVQICCGIVSNSIEELYIGSLEEEPLLKILQRGNNDLITNWLALAGPSSILNFVRSKAPDIDIPDKFVNRCHLCNELFTNVKAREVLQKHANERGEMVALMRGLLDWVTEDWAPSACKRCS